MNAEFRAASFVNFSIKFPLRTKCEFEIQYQMTIMTLLKWEITERRFFVRLSQAQRIKTTYKLYVLYVLSIWYPFLSSGYQILINDINRESMENL